MKKKTRSPSKRSPKKRSSAPSHVPTRGLYGWITHTELASADPAATKAWCAKVLGWTFKPSFPMPDGGEYHLFAYSDRSEEHTSELQSRLHLVCRLLLEIKTQQSSRSLPAQPGR